MEANKQNLYDLIDKRLSSTKIVNYKKGDVAEGVIDKLGDSYMVVKIDGVFDAIVPGSEIEKEGKTYKVGDQIKIFIIKPEDDYGVMLASQKRTTATQRWDLLEEAHKNDEAVIVSVVEANSGGLIVNIDGVVGFIPASLLDPNKVYKLEGGESTSKEDLQRELSRRLGELVGSKIKVKIMEVDKEKNKIIFSERLLLADQPSELRQKTIQNVKIGTQMDATVTAVTNYGIFVNAEGVDGLVHVSEISWDKVENPSSYAKVGDKIKVKLIDMSEDGKRVAYSMKQLTDDPWTEVSEEFKVGGKVKGTISEVEDYGLIIKIGEGITGLIHKSELSDEVVADPKEQFKIGDEVEAVILTISPSDRKMGLSIKRVNGSIGSSRSRTAAKSKKKVPGSLDIAGALAKAGLSVEVEEEAEEKPAKAKKVVKAKKKAE
jgi:small subunit ribosomal protein S1